MLQKISENISKLSIISVILGLYFSNALKSIGIVCLAVAILFHPATLKNFRLLFRNSLFISAVIIALFYVLSVCYGGNMYYYWISSKNKLLYFFVPVALLNLSLNKREIAFIKYLFVGCAMIQSVYSTIFLLHDPGVLRVYSLGQVLPTIEINHVEISWLISISILLLVNEVKNIPPVIGKTAAVLIAAWLFIFLHLFAVRTGLVAVYLFLLIFFIILFLDNKKQRKFLAVVPVLLVVAFFLSYKLSESMRSKINYTLYDVNRFRTNDKDLQLYSDSRRLQSIKIGAQLIKEHPWLGCGIGNIEDRCIDIYKKNYPQVLPDNYYRPHSLYIYVVSCFGIILGAVVLICFLYPLIYFLHHRNYLFFNIYFSVVVVSAWDVVMGTLFGECLYLLLIGWGIKMSLHENITPQQ